MNRWFVVAQHFQWSGEHAWSDKVPSSLMHAKEMGTQRTACGLRCDSWMKWFELRFSPGRPEMCPSCSRVVHEVGTRVRGAGSPALSAPAS